MDVGYYTIGYKDYNPEQIVCLTNHGLVPIYIGEGIHQYLIQPGASIAIPYDFVKGIGNTAPISGRGLEVSNLHGYVYPR